MWHRQKPNFDVCLTGVCKTFIDRVKRDERRCKQMWQTAAIIVVGYSWQKNDSKKIREAELKC